MDSLSELLTELGGDKLRVQELKNCMVSGTYSRVENQSSIEFITNEIGPHNFELNDKGALIIWFDNEKLKEAIARLKEKRNGKV